MKPSPPLRAGQVRRRPCAAGHDGGGGRQVRPRPARSHGPPWWLALWLAPLLAAGESRAENDRPPRGDVPAISLPAEREHTGLDGFLPVRVDIENPGRMARHWDFRVAVDARTGRARQETILRQRITVEPGASASEWLLVPLMEWTHAIQTPHIRATARSRGTAITSTSLVNVRHGFRHRVLIAPGMSRGNSLALSPFDPESLAAGWRRLSGWAGLVLPHPEWQSLSVGQNDAVRAWVRLGGRLLIVTDDESAQPAILREVLGDSPVMTRFFDSQGGAVRAMASLGEVQVRQGRLENAEAPFWVFDVEAFMAELERQPTSLQWTGDIVAPSVFSRRPEAASPPEKPERPLPWLLVAAACFAVMGPLPWMWAVSRGRRPRLLIVVPVAAVILAGLLMAAAVRQHGIGGYGARSVFVEWRPAEGAAHVIQNQRYRSGWLPTSSFRETAPLCIRFDDEFYFDSFRRVQLRDGVWSGDLFRSFDDRRHRLAAVLPAAHAETVTWLPASGFGSRPQAVSTLAWPLDELWLRCPQGRWHRSEGAVEPGATVEMRAVPREQAHGRWAELVAMSPLAEHALVENLRDENGRFFALAERHDGGAAIATFESIHWQTRLVMTGPVAFHKPSPSSAGAAPSQTTSRVAGGSPRHLP